MRLESNYSSERSQREQKKKKEKKKRRKDNKEESKWVRMEDIETAPLPDNKKPERRLENMGNRRGRKGNNIIKKNAAI